MFRDNTDRINCIDFSSDGTTLISSSDDDSIIIYDCTKGLLKRSRSIIDNFLLEEINCSFRFQVKILDKKVQTTFIDTRWLPILRHVYSLCRQ